ncbi:FAD-dependent oxidoreductase, partial [Planctomycetota bacterium]
MKLLIVGGVAGGAASAARARRLDEDAEIIMFERGEYISFANCGLPYFAGGVIKERRSLLVQTPEAFNARFNVDVRIRQDVIAIDPGKRTITVRKLESQEEYTETYDELVLAPGAAPFVPPIEGRELDCIFSVRTVPDIDRVKENLDSGNIQTALVIGGGFIGIEMAENLMHRGIRTGIIEMLDQVMPPFDREMANILHYHMHLKGLELYLSEKVTSITARDKGCTVNTDTGKALDADMVIMAVGVRPETGLAREAGLDIGKAGILVNAQMRTSDQHIYAVGDVVELQDPVLDIPRVIPLAGPAAKQARVAVNTIFGQEDTYNGTFGTAIVKVFALTAAVTGVSEQVCRLNKHPYEKIYTHPANHAGYYPGASQMSIKVIFDPENGTVLGAQVIGKDGVDKRIDVLATAVKHGLTVHDLAELELAYAPPYGSAKDAINLLGMAASNHLKGLSKLTHWDRLSGKEFLLDVRTPDEVALGTVPGATGIPVDELRDRLDEVPKDREIAVFCQVGIRAHIAVRILTGNGYTVTNISGGFKSYCNFEGDDLENRPCGVILDEDDESEQAVTTGEPSHEGHEVKIVKELDVRGLQCPGPIIQIKQAVEAVSDGEAVLIRASDPGFARDLPTWCETTGNRLEKLDASGKDIEAIVIRGHARLPAGG